MNIIIFLLYYYKHIQVLGLLELHKKIPKCLKCLSVCKFFLYKTTVSSSSLKVLWWVILGCQAKGSSLPFRLYRCYKFAVSGVLPLPLLRLHVPCHHLWRTPGRGHRGTCGKSQYLYRSQETLITPTVNLLSYVIVESRSVQYIHESGLLK